MKTMKTTLQQYTVEEICNGFVYNTFEGRGLYGLGGRLTIQPEYQRNYLYAEKGGEKEMKVIDSVLRGYPLGLLYFNTLADGKLEVLDGQQRITSLGRFVTGKFAVPYDGMEQYFDSLPKDLQQLILKTKLLVYECEGEESEIKQWFRTINIVGIPLNNQEINNAVFSGPFVTLAKEQFSNSRSANIQKWSAYVSGSPLRQDYLRTALEWVSKGDIEGYMAQHRNDTNIQELQTYFKSVIDWVSTVFLSIEKEMCGLNWGELYETYHKQAYDPQVVLHKQQELYADYYVKNRRGVFEYILGGCTKKELLDVRCFDEPTKKAVYARQTSEAQAKGVSNCPDCAMGHDSQKQKIWKLDEMDADHVTAWSKGGATDISNCQMLCKHHNRAKGNR